MPRGQWLRLYTGLLENHKIQTLSDSAFRATICLWCLAKEHDGQLPSVEVCAFRLRMSVEKFTKLFETVRHLFDETVDGKLVPHDWNEHQYKSDNPTERVRAFRKRRGNVSETPRARACASDSLSVSDSVSDSDSEGEVKKGEPLTAAEFNEPGPDEYAHRLVYGELEDHSDGLAELHWNASDPRLAIVQAQQRFLNAANPVGVLEDLRAKHAAWRDYHAKHPRERGKRLEYWLADGQCMINPPNGDGGKKLEW